MPLTLKPTSPLDPFTFSPPPSTPPDLENNVTLPRPPADYLPERDMHMFGAKPLEAREEQGRGLVRCNRCGRVSMEWSALEHKRICSHVLDGTPLTIKKAKTTETKKRRASEAVSSESASPIKKRPKLPNAAVNDNDSDDAPLSFKGSFKGMKKADVKKIQKEMARAEKKAAKDKEKKAVAERKRQRATNPLDFDRQCGVINDKGLPCSRSLTCKTHTVGAKRAVEGRTRSYDSLYLEWQRANNPNFKEPPPKREKDARKAESLKTRPSTNTGPTKKKKSGVKMGTGEWDEDRLDTPEAQREVADLVGIANAVMDKAGAAGRMGAWWGISGIGMGGMGRIGGVWRAATYEMAQVGEMFTKALAARPGSRPVVDVSIPPKKTQANQAQQQQPQPQPPQQQQQQQQQQLQQQQQQLLQAQQQQHQAQLAQQAQQARGSVSFPAGAVPPPRNGNITAQPLPLNLMNGLPGMNGLPSNGMNGVGINGMQLSQGARPLPFPMGSNGVPMNFAGGLPPGIDVRNLPATTQAALANLHSQMLQANVHNAQSVNPPNGQDVPTAPNGSAQFPIPV